TGRARKQGQVKKQEVAMSKAQKGNKEKKKPKADKNQPKTHVSAYKAAQGQGKPSFSVREKDLRLNSVGRVGCVVRAHLTTSPFPLEAELNRGRAQDPGRSTLEPWCVQPLALGR